MSVQDERGYWKSCADPAVLAESLQDSQKRVYGDFSGIHPNADISKFFSQEYIPEMIVVEANWLFEDIKRVVEAGLEHAQECLAVHDQQLGRTIRKNKEWAESLEKDIRDMELALARIRKYAKGN